MKQTELFQTAVKKAKAGERNQARTLLLQLVETEPQHELAWLWLSELVEEPEDKITALENALTLNPQRPQTQKRLALLRQKFQNASQPASPTFSSNGYTPNTIAKEIRFAEINKLFAANEIIKGREQLAAFLHRYTDDEAGWWLMVQHADSQANLLTALDHLLRLNAQHPDAPTVIKKIRPTREQCLQMGRLHERLEQWETAVRYYKRALKSPIKPDRLAAQKRLLQAEEQLKLSKIKFTSPTATVLRLALGPTILYAMLVLVQAGLNPLQVSPLLCAGNGLFLAGLLLISSLSYAPEHPWLQKVRDTAVFREDAFFRRIGLILILLPILLLILHGLSRLLALFLY